MNKTIDKDKLRKDYEKCVEDYVTLFLQSYDYGKYDPSEWVGKKMGEVYTITEDMYVDFTDIRYCVDNAISCDEFEEWYYYSERALILDINVPNLDSWHRGCPRLTEEQLSEKEEKYLNLKDLEDELKKEIEDINAKLSKDRNPY